MVLTQTQNETMSRALWRYGPAQQEVKTIEELAELQRALCRAMNTAHTGGMDDFLKAMDHVFEEIADVEIMLEQIMMIFDDARHEVDRWKQQKLARLKGQLDGED